jgi:hypothetical protein
VSFSRGRCVDFSNALATPLRLILSKVLALMGQKCRRGAQYLFSEYFHGRLEICP